MKKTVVLLLAIFYIAITSGMVVNIHYCMGDIASVNYGAEDHDACDRCGMEEKQGCCHTEHKLIRAGDTHMWVKPAFQFDTPAALPPSAPDIRSLAFTVFSPESFLYHSPPDRRGTDIGVFNCVFRI